MPRAMLITCTLLAFAIVASAGNGGWSLKKEQSIGDKYRLKQKWFWPTLTKIQENSDVVEPTPLMDKQANAAMKMLGVDTDKLVGGSCYKINETRTVIEYTVEFGEKGNIIMCLGFEKDERLTIVWNQYEPHDDKPVRLRDIWHPVAPPKPRDDDDDDHFGCGC